MARNFDALPIIGAVLAAAGVWLVRRDSVMFGGGTAPAASPCSEEALRRRVVEIARGELGSRDVQKYIALAAPQFAGQKPEWCGIFALWALKTAGLAPGKMWKTGLGFLETSPPLPKTTNPQPGDIAYYTKYQHQAIVARNLGDGRTENVNGNGQGGVVTLSTPLISDAAAFYSIRGLVREAVERGCA